MFSSQVKQRKCYHFIFDMILKNSCCWKGVCIKVISQCVWRTRLTLFSLPFSLLVVFDAYERRNIMSCHVTCHCFNYNPNHQIIIQSDWEWQNTNECPGEWTEFWWLDVLWNEMSVWMNMFVWFHKKNHTLDFKHHKMFVFNKYHNVDTSRKCCQHSLKTQTSFSNHHSCFNGCHVFQH